MSRIADKVYNTNECLVHPSLQLLPHVLRSLLSIISDKSKRVSEKELTLGLFVPAVLRLPCPNNGPWFDSML